MSGSNSEGYILNSGPNPERMFILWDAVNRGKQTDDEIKADTRFSDKQINRVVSGLHQLRMLEGGEQYDAVELSYESASDSRRTAFGLTILNNVMAESTPPDWSKQAALPLTISYLLSENLQRFNRMDKTLADKINTYHRNNEYIPRDHQGDPNDMNDRKLQNWVFFADFLGVVRKWDGKEYTTYLSPDLVSSLLQVGVEYLPDQASSSSEPAAISVRSWLELVSERFFPVELTSSNDIPMILAQTLVDLSERERIRVVEAGDEGPVGLQKTPTPGSMDAEANAIRLLK
ncbi:hypothetical protein [Haloarchaeobius sp. DFWS5]|uniref:hypothetical protein n=1 Tax=Haloarchaeobius sp. DFWS5 TaxID=3446114 RepID=UPI003EC0E60C